MKKSYFLLMLGLWMLLPATANAAIHAETIEYRQGDTVFEGYLAYDDALEGKRPGILVVHDWTGLQQYTKMRTEQLAGLGYVAFAPDIYGKGIRPMDPKDASAEASIYKKDRALTRERVLAGFKILQDQPLVDRSRTAAIGYCFGGMVALELARSGADLRGTVAFHGALDTPSPQDARNIKGKVLILHGADDPFVPAPQVLALEEEMRNAGVDFQVNLYGGAVHAFTIPEEINSHLKGASYNASADKRSWEAMKLFFHEIFS